jgi:hypothetical protein
MSQLEHGDFVEILALALVLGFGWLLVCAAIPRLRDSVGASYGIAIGLSWIPSLSAAGGPTIFNVTATLFCDAVLCFTMFYRLGRRNPPPNGNGAANH